MCWETKRYVRESWYGNTRREDIGTLFRGSDPGAEYLRINRKLRGQMWFQRACGFPVCMMPAVGLPDKRGQGGQSGAGPPRLSSKTGPQPEPSGNPQFIEFKGYEIRLNGAFIFFLKNGLRDFPPKRPEKKLGGEGAHMYDYRLSKQTPKSLVGA